MEHQYPSDHVKRIVLKIFVNHLKPVIMRLFFYLVVLLLTICWAIGFFAFQIGALVHILLVIAIIVLLVDVSATKRSM